MKDKNHMKNHQWILKKRPNGKPNIETDFEMISTETQDLDYGQILVESQYLSLDPYMRGRMNAGASYANPVEIGSVMEGEVIGKVIESKSKKYKSGDFINTRLGWQKFGVLDDDAQINKINIPKDIPITYSLGVIGMPGRTAYLGFFDVCKPKAGETIVVSAASGAVGSIVGQIAKIMGCRVIGIVGSEKKVEYCKNELKFDICLNYNKQDIDKELSDIGTDFVNMYFDNVGGQISDAVMNHLSLFSRTAVCGQIANYNNTSPAIGPRVARTLLTKQSTMQGFIVFNFAHKYDEANNALTNWVQSGEIIYKEDINKSFDSIPMNFMKLFEGENFGKLIVDVRS
ncbi:MAG: NADP-dependent oxidoreductase [Dehalococcoidia bacterium]|jgi:NADPH:quinone reductase|nr:NADP-dependent oxidoreductase [Dehalococcoidia bacterium]